MVNPCKKKNNFPWFIYRNGACASRVTTVYLILKTY